MKKAIIPILCIILIIVSFILINEINGDKNMKDNSITENKNNNEEVNEIPEENNDNENNNEEEKEIEEEKKEEKNENNQKENTNEEPEQLTSDFSTIAAFKEENQDRYIAYKTNNQKLSDEEIVRNVNVNIDYAFYTNNIAAINKNTPLILVDKYYYLDENYVPNNLVEVNTKCATGGGIYAVDEAVSSFEEMCNDVKSIGLAIKTISAYRSYNYQKKLYEGYLKSDTKESVDTYSARPGHSEHQTGYAFDVYNTKVGYTSFGSTDEYQWVKINAHKYGFIIRYTTENSYITGYKNEPWHLRYVGVEAAKYIYENNITFEEYLLNKK